VLWVQDTTSLNHSTHPATENLGPIGSQQEGIIGLLVHSTSHLSASMDTTSTRLRRVRPTDFTGQDISI
jgi:hypothetical protein